MSVLRGPEVSSSPQDKAMADKCGECILHDEEREAKRFVNAILDNLLAAAAG